MSFAQGGKRGERLTEIKSDRVSFESHLNLIGGRIFMSYVLPMLLIAISQLHSTVLYHISSAGSSRIE